MAVETGICEFGWQAPDFGLTATDGKLYSLANVSGEKGTLLMFICNHCPYVKSIVDRIVRDAKDLQLLGIGVAAICANDAQEYPEDSFDNMKIFAQNNGFCFPYLHDASQEVARSYDAVCTPDFFGFNAENKLQYRGRLDASRKQAADAGAPRELYMAMKQIAQTGHGPKEQHPSMGCSIKWKAA